MSHLAGVTYEEFWETLKPVLFPAQTEMDGGVQEVDISDFNDIPDF